MIENTGLFIYSLMMNSWPSDLQQKSFYLVGIKGTGMTAFAELLVSRGAQVSGSDVQDVFYTDEILESLHIPVFQGFSPQNVPPQVDLVVYSAAYDPSKHPELLEIASRSIPMLEYTRALGAFSEGLDSSGVSGVHGKTSTTAMAGTLMKTLGLPGSVLVGSGVSNFNGRSTLVQGSDFFIAETCEYRRHFLHFHPKRIILTSLEPDHQDYFKDYEDIASAFVEYALRLPEGGRLIFCADDKGASDVASRVSKLRKDIALIPYGFTAEGDYRILSVDNRDETQIFTLQGFSSGLMPGILGEQHKVEFTLRVPGRHNVLNATAALALLTSIYTDRFGNLSRKIITSMAAGLEQFRGSKRRSEILGEAGGILFMDDYAHHPTAIRTTLEGFRNFYPGRRLVVDFMSHTYSRTAALFEEFASSFDSAHEVILHDIYASAREQYDGSVTGAGLFERTTAYHSRVRFFPKPMDAISYLKSSLGPGDLFVTMGAGDNWKLGRMLFDEYRLVSGQE